MFAMACKAVARRLSIAASTTLSSILFSFSLFSTCVSFSLLVIASSFSAAATFARISFFSWSGVIPRTPTNPSHCWAAPSPRRERDRASNTTLNNIIPWTAPRTENTAPVTTRANHNVLLYNRSALNRYLLCLYWHEIGTTFYIYRLSLSWLLLLAYLLELNSAE